MPSRAPVNWSEPPLPATQSGLLIVVGQSVRFVVDTAARLGYRVRAADCFADTDSLSSCQQFIQLPPLHQLAEASLLAIIKQLAGDENCQLVCTTGVERFYPLLSQLPEHINFAGNPATVFATVCQPANWFQLLTELQLPFPQSHWQRPNGSGWLFKATGGWGGSHVDKILPIDTENGYYQRLIAGHSYSILFFARPDKMASIISFNRQYPVNTSHHDFRLQAIHNTPQLAPSLQQAISDAVQLLCQRLPLQGLNSLDFMLDHQDNYYLLELNPRPSASCQCLAEDSPWLNWQLTGRLQPARRQNAGLRMLYYLYAEADMQITASLDWPAYCHDIPVPGTRIPAGEPVCSLLVNADDEKQLWAKLEQCRAALLHRLENKGPTTHI